MFIYSFVICLWPWILDVPPGIQLRGSNIKVDLVADDGNDVQKSSAISIKTFNGIIDDVKSTSPVIIEEEVSVRNLVSSTHYLSFFNTSYHSYTNPTTFNYFKAGLAAYDLVHIVNRTPDCPMVSGKVSYKLCKADHYVMDKDWTAKSRGVCLLTEITATVQLKTGYTEVATPYQSAGTSYSQFMS